MKTIGTLFGALALIAATGCSEPSPSAVTGGTSVSDGASPAVPGKEAADAAPDADRYVLDSTVDLITGEPIDLNSYRGKVLLIVNTASQCGLTGQYAQLQQIHEEFQAQGFEVLAFPSNDFQQERGTNEEIAEFCEARFGVTFPMFAKVAVKGEDAHPLFARVNELSEEPSWNFTKYLIDREGRLVERFDPRTVPDSEALVSRIRELLDQS